MRASRLLSLLLLLQTRGRMTAAELSAELEVSIRTVYRDMDALSSAGVPVYADRGPAGGYQLLDGYRTKLNGLTEAEASSLFLAGLPGPAADLGLAEVAAAAELKLLAALPPGPRSQAARMRERFLLDVPGWYRGAEDVPFLAEVAAAVWDQRPLRLTYRRWGPADVIRDVEPYGLVLKGGSWYLAAECDGSMRTYRVSRILSLTGLPGRFERSADFDLPAFWERFSAEFAARLYTGTAQIRLAPGGEGLLTYTIGEERTAPALAEAVPDPERPGWKILEIPVEGLNGARWTLLRLGALIEVLGPEDLREMMAQSVREMAVMYR
ncbi:helix-turn-helix transcriptional regulator [Herbidospora sp. RD11066]